MSKKKFYYISYLFIRKKVFLRCCMRLMGVETRWIIYEMFRVGLFGLMAY